MANKKQKMKIHVVSISSEIIEDSYKEGELASTGCGLPLTRIGKTYDSIELAIKSLSDDFGLPHDRSDYNEDVEGRLLTSVQVADHSNNQNGGWFAPTSDEIEKWKNGKMKLFNEEYTIKFITKDDLS